jgi:hypothetical protein
MANKYLKFEYWNTCDLGNIYYQGGQHFWFYLDGDVLEPFHEDTEDGQEDGEGDFIPTYRRQMKRYRIRTSLIPDYLIDAIQRMKLHDNIELTFKTGEVEQIYNLDIEPEWQFEKYCWQGTVTMTFDMDEKVVLGACCDNLTVTPAVITEVNTIITGRAFYVSNDGDDGDDGQTETTAWQTLAKVQSSSFEPEDCIVFRRGDTFRGSLYKDTESGSLGLPITFGCYGTNSAGNVWKTTATLGTLQNDISNLIFNNEASCGVKVINIGLVDTQGDFFYNTADNLVYIYSVGNPATYYTHIEACGHHDINQGLIKWIDSDYVTVQYLDVRYSSAAGIEFRTCDNCIIESNDVSWIGGEYVNPAIDATRVGNGISIILNASNIIVRYNKINQCFDAGISPQGWGVFTQNDLQFYYNTISNCWYSYELWTDAGVTMTNTHFYNNTCYNSGGSFSATQRPDATYSAHVVIWSINGDMTNTIIKNNIFDISFQHAIRIHEATYPGLVIDNNLYNVADLAYTVAGSFATLALWQADCGQEANSVSGDPLFMSSTDFRLQAGSPAINEGASLGLTRDIDGVLVSSPPEIGAYEY